jgi:hypothetical protein
MSEINFTDPDQLLERIVTAIAEEPMPEFRDPFENGPQFSVPQSAVRQETRPILRRSRDREYRPWTQWTIVGVATATLAALVVLLSPHGPTGSPGAAFAQVQQAISNTKSMRCRTLDYHGNRDPYISSGVSLLGVGSYSEGPQGWVSIRNYKKLRSMWIDHQKRKAHIQQLYPDGEVGASYFENLRDLPASGAKALGTAQYEGKPVLKFALQNDGEFIVLVDAQTHLPIRMELKLDKGLPGGETFREVTSDFVFDAPVDESLFDIKVPPGYSFTRCEEPPGRKPIDTRKWIVSPQQGLGPVPMHATTEQILATLGAPDQIEETYRGPEALSSPGVPAHKGQPEVVFEKLRYPSRGFEISVSSKKGMMVFNCFGRLWGFDSCRDFHGETDRQIRLGATVDDVLAAYGKPDVRSRLREEVLHYFHKGWSFTFRNGKLAYFSVAEPRSEKIEFIDHGDGSWLERVKPSQNSGEKKK